MISYKIQTKSRREGIETGRGQDQVSVKDKKTVW